MNQTELNVLHVVHAFFGKLNKETFIAGGYARNRFFGKPAKDIDVFVPFGAAISPSEAFGLAEDLVLAVSSVLPSGYIVGIAQAYHDAVGDFNERVHTLVTVDGPEASIDIVVHKENTIVGVLEKFDCNINQVILNDNSVPTWLYYDEQPEKMVLLKSVSPARLKRLLEISAELSIPIDEESFRKFDKPEAWELDSL